MDSQAPAPVLMRLCMPGARLKINEVDARECCSLNPEKGQKHIVGELSGNAGHPGQLNTTCSKRLTIPATASQARCTIT